MKTHIYIYNKKRKEKSTPPGFRSQNRESSQWTADVWKKIVPCQCHGSEVRMGRLVGDHRRVTGNWNSHKLQPSYKKKSICGCTTPSALREWIHAQQPVWMPSVRNVDLIKWPLSVQMILIIFKNLDCQFPDVPTVVPHYNNAYSPSSSTLHDFHVTFYWPFELIVFFFF